MSVLLLQGDARAIPLAAGSVHEICTSPPYYALRSYLGGNDPLKQREIGLEQSPAAYVSTLVEVGRECWRVLRDDGVMFLNLGDSYASGKGTCFNPGGGANSLGQDRKAAGVHPLNRGNKSDLEAQGLRPKSLIGIPWMVARAMQEPYYTGKIKKKTDRAYLAGWLDGEGTITFVERNRGPDHTSTHDVRVFVTNCDRAILDEFCGMTSGHVYQHEDGRRENRYGSRPCFRWQMGTHDAASLIREIYPYLRSKRRQAALVWTLYLTLRHRNGHARTPADVTDKRHAIAEMIRTLNAGGDIDLPGWVEEPPSPTEPGWILRSAAPWLKRNAMPESVTDRPSSALEYIFMFVKSEKYFYDSDAVRKPMTPSSIERGEYGHNSCFKEQFRGSPVDGRYQDGKKVAKMSEMWNPAGRNRRNTDPFFESLGLLTDDDGAPLAFDVNPEPLKMSHYAAFPQKLVEPMILAGTSAFGCCSCCGNPYKRVVERKVSADLEDRPYCGEGQMRANGTAGSNGIYHSTLGQGEKVSKSTLGWAPTCACAADVIPATVLDPFAGSGTTLRVALKQGRHAVGLDLSGTYLADIAAERLDRVQLALPEAGR